MRHQLSVVVPGGLAEQGWAWGMSPQRARELGEGWDSTPGKGGIGAGQICYMGPSEPEHLESWALVLTQAVDTRYPEPTACPVSPSQTRVLCSELAPQRAPLSPPAPRGCSLLSRS